jgi:hypothetical protein
MQCVIPVLSRSSSAGGLLKKPEVASDIRVADLKYFNCFHLCCLLCNWYHILLTRKIENRLSGLH